MDPLAFTELHSLLIKGIFHFFMLPTHMCGIGFKTSHSLVKSKAFQTGRNVKHSHIYFRLQTRLSFSS